MFGKEAGCDLFYEVIHELWGHLLPKVKVRALSTISLLEDEPVKVECGKPKVEGGKIKCEGSTASSSKSSGEKIKDEVQEVVVIAPKGEVKTEGPSRRRLKVIKIEIEDSDDESEEQAEYQAIVKQTGGPTTLEEVEMRMNYLRRLPA